MTRLRARSDDPPARGPRAQAVRRRCAHLAAQGCTAAEIAAVEGMEAGQVEALLGEEAFGRLARAYEVFGSRPDAERRDKLVRLAQFLIDEAIGLGHVRVAFFVVREELHGRDAAETVADKLIAQRMKAAEPLPAPRPEGAGTPRRPHLPAHPADRMAQRGCRDLMRALLDEFRVRAEGVARAASAAAIAAAARLVPLREPAGLPPHRRLIAKLLTSAAAITSGGDCPPKLAQAP